MKFGKRASLGKDSSKGQDAELDEFIQIVDDEHQQIDDAELDDIGNLGNEGDDLSDIDEMLAEIETRPPTRMAWLINRAADCIRSLQSMRDAPCGPWPHDRIPEEHWRLLADEALGLIGPAVRAEIEAQRIVESARPAERQELKSHLDSSIAMGLFRKAFEKEREVWERAYWLRGLDESFGRRQWSGPQGWRLDVEAKYVAVNPVRSNECDSRDLMR